MYVDECTCVDVWNFGTCGVLMMIMNVCCVCAWASRRLWLAIIHVHIVHFVHYGLRLPWLGDNQMDQLIIIERTIQFLLSHNQYDVLHQWRGKWSC